MDKQLSPPASSPSRPDRLLRLAEIIGPRERRIPVSKSSWWAGVKSGRYPAPRKIGPRTTVWRECDISELVERLFAEPTPSKAA